MSVSPGAEHIMMRYDLVKIQNGTIVTVLGSTHLWWLAVKKHFGLDLVFSTNVFLMLLFGLVYDARLSKPKVILVVIVIAIVTYFLGTTR